MNPETLLRMRELTGALNKASEAYYQRDREIMSDREYDALYDELERMENGTGVVLSGSPTQKTGYEAVSGLTKINHDSPMLSLNKTKDKEDMAAFLSAGEGVLSWKLDGLTVALKYENGRLKQAVTRGNGETGEDVTHNAKFFTNLPVKINYTGTLEVRGEAVIHFEDFNKINEGLPAGERYKNPRNLCSGTIRQLDSRVFARRPVRFYLFSVLSAADTTTILKSERLGWAEQLGFQTAGWEIANADDIYSKIEGFEAAAGKTPFATDGLVLTYNDINLSGSLGRTAKFPRDSIAFKWRDEEAETQLIKIEWNTSRTGLINPVAVFMPVELSGTTINRASLHNVSVAEGLELGEGDLIRVYKANMIIPQVSDNLTRTGTAGYPSVCPVCGYAAALREINGIKYLYCDNPDCAAKKLQSMVHFVSRDAMNIEGISEATLEKFIAEGFIRDYADIYTLTNFSEAIRRLDGFGAKSRDKMLDAVEHSKDAELHRFIYGLGINQVGLVGAKALCARFDYDIDRIMEAEPDELVQIDGFGEIIADSVYNYFKDERNKKLVNETMRHLRIKKREPIDDGDLIFKGQTFVITGELEIYDNRKELQDEIEKRGGKTAGAVTRNTTYLINNDAGSKSAKNKRATELGVKVITEEEFLIMNNF